jgi:hypothetical protein
LETPEPGDFLLRRQGHPFSKAPPGTNGAPKQNWAGAPAGVFGRFLETGSLYTNNLSTGPGLFLTPTYPFLPVKPNSPGNHYAGYSVLSLPLNARLELLLGTTFVSSNPSSPTGGYVAHWGDTSVQAALAVLEFSDTRITDDAMAVLATLPRLERLVLHRNRITAAGLAHLAAKRLRRLVASGVPWPTRPAITTLARAIPGLHVEAN